MPAEQTPEQAQGSLVEAFVGMAGAPDSTEAADAADEALWALDAVLEQAG